MSTDERRALLDEIALLSASIEDARAEHERGDLDAASLDAIVERDDARLADAHARLDELGPEAPLVVEEPVASDETPSRRRGLIGGLLVAAVVLVVVLVAVLIPALRSPAPSKAAQVATLVNQAEALDQQGKAVQALALYQKALALDPNQPEALAESGWIIFQAGSRAGSIAAMDRGEQRERKAVLADPTLFAGHLYLGAIDLVGGDDPKAAMEQFKIFLSLNPTSDWIRDAKLLIDQAAADLHEAPPTS